MEQKQHKHGFASFAWVLPLLIGLGFAMENFVVPFEGFPTEPIQWDLVGESLVDGGIFFFPFAIASWFLWACRGKKMPSLAFVVTLIGGSFMLYWGLAECIIGFTSRPIEWTEAAGGLGMMATIVIPFFAVAWLLWFRPMIGAIALICLGVFLFHNFNLEIKDLLDPTMAIFVGLPVVLGIFTLVREVLAKRGRIRLKNAD